MVLKKETRLEIFFKRFRPPYDLQKDVCDDWNINGSVIPSALVENWLSDQHGLRLVSRAVLEPLTCVAESNGEECVRIHYGRSRHIEDRQYCLIPLSVISKIVTTDIYQPEES